MYIYIYIIYIIYYICYTCDTCVFLANFVIVYS